MTERRTLVRDLEQAYLMAQALAQTWSPTERAAIASQLASVNAYASSLLDEYLRRAIGDRWSEDHGRTFMAMITNANAGRT